MHCFYWSKAFLLRFQEEEEEKTLYQTSKQQIQWKIERQNEEKENYYKIYCFYVNSI